MSFGINSTFTQIHRNYFYFYTMSIRIISTFTQWSIRIISTFTQYPSELFLLLHKSIGIISTFTQCPSELFLLLHNVHQNYFYFYTTSIGIISTVYTMVHQNYFYFYTMSIRIISTFTQWSIRIISTFTQCLSELFLPFTQWSIRIISTFTRCPSELFLLLHNVHQNYFYFYTMSIRIYCKFLLINISLTPHESFKILFSENLT